MTELLDFTEDSSEPMSNLIQGKIVKSVEIDRHYDDFLIFNFTDGKRLKIKYDWIYEWELE